jgi:AcrR family transcriptional regulator
MVSRRRLDPEARKREIVEAAQRLLARDGSAVRVDDVVAEAGAAKGTFYHYFPTWDDLLESLRDATMSDFDRRYPLPTERDGPIDWVDLMGRLSEVFVDFTLGQEKLHEVLFHGDFARRRPPGDNAVDRLTAIIRAAQEAGDFAELDPEPTARLVFALVHDAADAVSEGADRNRTLAALKTMLRRALAAHGDAR